MVSTEHVGVDLPCLVHFFHGPLSHKSFSSLALLVDVTPSNFLRKSEYCRPWVIHKTMFHTGIRKSSVLAVLGLFLVFLTTPLLSAEDAETPQKISPEMFKERMKLEGRQWESERQASCFQDHLDMEKMSKSIMTWNECGYGLFSFRNGTGGDVQVFDYPLVEYPAALGPTSLRYLCGFEDFELYISSTPLEGCRKIGFGLELTGKPGDYVCENGVLQPDPSSTKYTEGEGDVITLAREDMILNKASLESVSADVCTAPGKEEERGIGRRLFSTSDFDSAVFLEITLYATGISSHLHYHGVDEINHYWDLDALSRYSGSGHGCRPFYNQGAFLPSNQLVYGVSRGDPRVKIVTVGGLIARTFGGSYRVNSSNQAAITSDGIMKTISCFGVGCYAAVWVDMNGASGMGTINELHHEAAGYTECKYAS